MRRVASLPRLPGRLRARELALAEEVSAKPKSRAAEAIRTLRNVLATPGSGLPRSLAITSALPGDGKTSVALALGRSLAGSGLRVLLIEADLRRGRLAGAAGGSGLADVIEKRCALAQAVVDDGRSTLRLLPAGQATTAPGDLLSGEAFRRLVTAAAAEHDCVLVDTPPLGAVSDALVVARAVETTLLVVRADSTPRDGVAAAVKELLHADLPIAGVVLNATDPVLVGGRSRRGHRRVHAYLET